METGDVIAKRWSPRSYTSDAIDIAELGALFQAASRAQSSVNEQPWRYLIATKDDGENREKLESYLLEGNAFAKDAWVLGISFAKKTFTRNGKHNALAVHDLGAANQLLALRAFDLGWNTRFMAGFHADKATESAPDDFEPIAMFVIGKATDDALGEGPSDLGRRPVGEFVSRAAWGTPLL